MEFNIMGLVVADRFFYFFIFLLTTARVLTSRVLACPIDFDCQAYIQMTKSLVYDPGLHGHHAMRILPSSVASVLQMFGFPVEIAFQILSGGLYILFGGLVFWVLRRFEVKSWLAFAITLLCLAPHHAMRIPLQLVYQTCDMMTYPLSVMLIYFSLKNNITGVFILACISVVTKQNIFIFAELSLLYCFVQNKRKILWVYMLGLAGAYSLLQTYYHAGHVMGSHIVPVDDFFTFSHLYFILIDSDLLTLFIPILPFLILYFKSILIYLIRYWHIGLYIGIVVGQPILAYHLTGNNFPRLALQGVWILYLVLGFVMIAKNNTKITNWLFNNIFIYIFVVYALGVYFIWDISQRLILMGLLSLVIAGMFIYKKRRYAESQPLIAGELKQI